MDHSLRQKRLAIELRRGRVEALLVTHLPNIFYLCGFTGSAGVLLFQTGDRSPRLTFFTDGRYTQQAKAEVQGARVVIAKGAAMAEACDAVVKNRIRNLSFESEHLAYIFYQQIRHRLRSHGRAGAGIKLRPLPGTIEQLRALKEPGEITQLRAAIKLAAELFPTALSAMRPGLSEA